MPTRTPTMVVIAKPLRKPMPIVMRGIMAAMLVAAAPKIMKKALPILSFRVYTLLSFLPPMFSSAMIIWWSIAS